MRSLVRRHTSNKAPRHVVRFAGAAMLALIALGAFALMGTAQRVPPTRQPGTVTPRVRPNLIVRGYITAAPRFQGPTGVAPANSLARGQDKDIYLPGVKVYLRAGASRLVSTAVTTDLSGRFTVYAPYAPQAGRYRICWQSDVYGAGCDSRAINTDGQPQFISAIRIPLKQRAGFVSLVGHVTTADGAVPRTFDPMFNVNSFATVSLTDEKGNQLAQVYVNNNGDYLLPYVPIKQKINVTAAIESAKFIQEIRPEAKLEAAPVSVLNLRFENHRPQLNPLIAADAANKHVQNAAPGSTVFLRANARDLDGDALKYAWFVGEGQGQALQTNGPEIKWELPGIPGRYMAEVLAYDDKGGYDRAVVSVLSGAAGVPFTGIVVTPGGQPVAQASVEIVGNPLVRDRHRITVPDGEGFCGSKSREPGGRHTPSPGRQTWGSMGTGDFLSPVRGAHSAAPDGARERMRPLFSQV